ncbi:MAG: hypothetical protein AABX37_02530 [Nanoarchaeota archaeon]
MVLMYSHKQFPLCVECHLKQLNHPINDPQFQKFFDIPQKLYQESYFLRKIKENYLRFGSLTEKQIETFKKVVEDLKQGKKPVSEDSL